MSDILGEIVTPAAIRQKLHRARIKFGELLVAEIRKTVSLIDVESELMALDLLKYLE